MAIDNPIIIFGTGRSGTTVFHQMLSEHPHLAWLSSVCGRSPESPGANAGIMKLLENAVDEQAVREKYDIGEYYAFWEAHAKGFSTPFRDLLATDVTNRSKKNILRAVSQLTTEKRNRLLLKITGWPRVGFLSEVFSEARFIHVVRDGRAVANSLLSVDFWRGWGGPDKWRWGPLSEIHQAEWIKHEQSFVALAAIQWKILMDAAEEAEKRIDPSRIMNVKYEDLCADPMLEFKRVSAFCELEWSADFEERVNGYRLVNTNSRFEQDLTPGQRDILSDVLREYLKKFGYL